MKSPASVASMNTRARISKRFPSLSTTAARTVLFSSFASVTRVSVKSVTLPASRIISSRVFCITHGSKAKVSEPQ